MRTPTLAVQVQLTLGWTTYLLFISDIRNFVWKTNQGEAESIVIFCYLMRLYRWWMRGVGVGQEVLFRAS